MCFDAIMLRGVPPHFYTGAGLTSLYEDSSSFPVYQPPLDINTVIYNMTVTGGLQVGLGH